MKVLREEHKMPTLESHTPEFKGILLISCCVNAPGEHDIRMTQVKVLKGCFNLKSDITCLQNFLHSYIYFPLCYIHTYIAMF